MAGPVFICCNYEYVCYAYEYVGLTEYIRLINITSDIFTW